MIFKYKLYSLILSYIHLFVKRNILFERSKNINIPLREELHMPLSFGSDRKNCRRYPIRTPADGTEPYEEIPSDIQGSYTGVPYDSEDNMPVQDADDL